MSSDTASAVVGGVFWLLLIGLAFWAKWWAHRRQRRVSRNGATSSTTGTGPKWEQDKPYPECFEEDDL